jgi:hypothetical protein
MSVGHETWPILKYSSEIYIGRMRKSMIDCNLANSDVQKRTYRWLVNALLLLSPPSGFWCASGALVCPIFILCHKRIRFQTYVVGVRSPASYLIWGFRYRNRCR